MSVSFNLKCYVGVEIYCSEINVDALDEFTFTKLLEAFHALSLSEQCVGLKWIDDENELICLRNDADLAVALRNLHRVGSRDALRVRLPPWAAAAGHATTTLGSSAKRMRSSGPITAVPATCSGFDQGANAALQNSSRGDVEKSVASTTVPTSGDDTGDITTVGGGDKVPQAKLAAMEKELADKDAIIEAQKADVEDLASRLRKSFYYFLPPNWRLTKDDIGGLSKQQLQGVDLSEFFTAYEVGLKELVIEHKTAVQEAKRATEQVKNDLVALRGQVIVFLRTLNPALQLNPDLETDDVESILQKFINAPAPGHLNDVD